MNLVNEFGGDNCGEKKITKTFLLTKEFIAAGYLTPDHVSKHVSNNVGNYLTIDIKRIFD